MFEWESTSLIKHCKILALEKLVKFLMFVLISKLIDVKYNTRVLLVLTEVRIIEEELSTFVRSLSLLVTTNS